MIPSIGMEPPGRIISASRRTDLPGHHPDVCVQRLLGLRRPVHSVFFWTRFPAALTTGPLGELVRLGLESSFVHLTLTGLGGTALEPGAPTARAVVRELDRLLATLRGEPRRLLWRFDPVLPGVSRLETFATLAAEMGQRGVKTCIFSFPAEMSLKGSLDPQYERFGIRRAGRAEKRETALRLAEVAHRHGLTLHACNQPRVVADCGGAVRAASCISAALAAELHPRGAPLDVGRDPSQRRNCNCDLSHDIGRYEDLCRSGCAYCYSRAGGPDNHP
jgi:hypothetical protein